MTDHLQAEIVIRPHFGRRRMIDLKGLALLAKIGGVSADVDYIANAQGTRLEPQDRDLQVAVIVGDDADALPRRSDLRRRARRRCGCYGLGRPTDGRRFDRGLRDRLGFLG